MGEVPLGPCTVGFGSLTLSQLAFPKDIDPNFPNGRSPNGTLQLLKERSLSGDNDDSGALRYKLRSALTE